MFPHFHREVLYPSDFLPLSLRFYQIIILLTLGLRVFKTHRVEDCATRGGSKSDTAYGIIPFTHWLHGIKHEDDESDATFNPTVMELVPVADASKFRRDPCHLCEVRELRIDNLPSRRQRRILVRRQSSPLFKTILIVVFSPLYARGLPNVELHITSVVERRCTASSSNH